MKKGAIAVLATILTLLVLLGVQSCSRESDNLDYSPQTFAYKVGSVWYTGGLNHCWYYDSLPALRAEFYVNPVTANYLFIEVDSANYLPPRIYNIGYDSITGAHIRLRYFADGSHIYTSASGNLTITSFDTLTQRISGTFQFTGTSGGTNRQITGGQFDNLAYIRQ